MTKRILCAAAAVLALSTIASAPAYAKHRHHHYGVHHARSFTGFGVVGRHHHRGYRHVRRGKGVSYAHVGGNVRSSAGAHATVSSSYAGAFQAYINDLEANGARILFMGGYSPEWQKTKRGNLVRTHMRGSMHYSGLALDVCQLRRGIVDRRCNLPDRSQIIQIARRHGLTEGASWCNSDYGHAQVGVSGRSCRTSRYAMSKKMRREAGL